MGEEEVRFQESDDSFWWWEFELGGRGRGRGWTRLPGLLAGCLRRRSASTSTVPPVLCWTLRCPPASNPACAGGELGHQKFSEARWVTLQDWACASHNARCWRPAECLAGTADGGEAA